MPVAIEVEESIHETSNSDETSNSENETVSVQDLESRGSLGKQQKDLRQDEFGFKINVTPTDTDRKPSVVVGARERSEGLVPPPKKETRRLSENPRNINLLHDVPRENNRVRKKRKSARRSSDGSRASSRAMLSKLTYSK